MRSNRITTITKTAAGGGGGGGGSASPFLAKMLLAFLGMFLLGIQILMWILHQSSSSSSTTTSIQLYHVGQKLTTDNKYSILQQQQQQELFLAEIQSLKQSLASLEESQRKSNELIEQLVERLPLPQPPPPPPPLSSSKSTAFEPPQDQQQQTNPLGAGELVPHQEADESSSTSDPVHHHQQEQLQLPKMPPRPKANHFRGSSHHHTMPPTKPNRIHHIIARRWGAGGGSTNTNTTHNDRYHNKPSTATTFQEARNLRYHHQHQEQHQQVRQQQQQRYLAFIHIGKAGGTSFDALASKIVRGAPNSGYKYHGNRHFDWTEIDRLKSGQRLGKQVDVDVVTLLREPVSRSLSHFYFWKNQRWLVNHKMYHQSIGQYILGGDKRNLLETRDIWQDGQAGVSWLTGTHIGDWVNVPHLTPQQVLEREQLSLNTTYILPLAAKRLRETKWFGILEDLERSMILLQYEFNLSSTPKMSNSNHNHHKRDTQQQKQQQSLSTNEQVQEALKSLMPQDIWLYEYAKRLFEARWNAYQTGMALVKPEEPPIPKELSCTSTRFNLICTKGPLAKFFPPGDPPLQLS